MNIKLRCRDCGSTFLLTIKFKDYKNNELRCPNCGIEFPSNTITAVKDYYKAESALLTELDNNTERFTYQFELSNFGQ